MPHGRHLSDDEPYRWSLTLMTDEETKTIDARITKIGDQIAGLTLKEAVDLADYMKEAYSIEPAAG